MRTTTRWGPADIGPKTTSSQEPEAFTTGGDEPKAGARGIHSGFDTAKRGALPLGPAGSDCGLRCPVGRGQDTSEAERW